MSEPAAMTTRSLSLKMCIVACHFRCALKLARLQDPGPTIKQARAAICLWTKTTMAAVATGWPQRANLRCRQQSRAADACRCSARCVRTRPTMRPPCASICRCTRVSDRFAVRRVASASPARSTSGYTCAYMTRNETTMSSPAVTTTAAACQVTRQLQPRPKGLTSAGCAARPSRSASSCKGTCGQYMRSTG